MSAAQPADGKIGGLLSGDRPSGSVTGSLEGLRGLWGGGGDAASASITVSLISSSLPPSWSGQRSKDPYWSYLLTAQGRGEEKKGLGGHNDDVNKCLNIYGLTVSQLKTRQISLKVLKKDKKRHDAASKWNVWGQNMASRGHNMLAYNHKIFFKKYQH